jgi:hypothetical protein
MVRHNLSLGPIFAWGLKTRNISKTEQMLRVCFRQRAFEVNSPAAPTATAADRAPWRARRRAHARELAGSDMTRPRGAAISSGVEIQVRADVAIITRPSCDKRETVIARTISFRPDEILATACCKSIVAIVSTILKPN